MKAPYRDYKANCFFQALHDARVDLPASSIEEFFQGTVCHFLGVIPEKVGKEILMTFSVLFHQSDSYTLFFTRHNYTQFLPFHQKNLTDYLLEVLYEIALVDPRAFTKNVVDLFGRMIVRRPNKALIIISILLKNFSGLDYQLYIVNTLFDGAARFQVPESGATYAQLLTYLATQFPEIREQREIDIYNCLLPLLLADDAATINYAYAGLSFIAAKRDDLAMPFAETSMHIRHPEVSEAALNFLLVAPLFSSEVVPQRLINNLILCAEKSSTATLVLMRLSEERNIAQYMIQTCEWMGLKLPTYEYTLRLFLVVFSHKQLRNDIGHCEYFVDFITNQAEVADGKVHNLLSKIIRRIDLDPALIDAMSQGGFFASYLARADVLNTVKSKYLAILMVDTIAKHCFTREMIPMCKTLVSEIKENGDNAEAALRLGIDLCNYRRCAGRLHDLKIADWLDQNMSKIKAQKMAKHLIKLTK